MDMVISYIIKSVIASGVLYAYYQLALKDKKFHSYNRFYLLLTVMISLVVPFINFRWFIVDGTQHAPLAGWVNGINSPAAGHPAELFTIGSVLLGVSTVISSVFLLLLVSKIQWIYKVRRRGTRIKMQGFTFIETGVKQAPFSFLSNLFWKQGLPATGTYGEKIFTHELAHIRQKHTYDKLFTQLVCCLFWMNPFYWLMQKELNTIHEFIADAASVEEGDTGSFAEMLLHAHNEGSYLSPAHPFFNSSIKRRLIMISLSNKIRYSYARRILALPVALLVLAVLSASVKAQTGKKAALQPVKQVQQPAGDTIPKPAAIPSTKSLEPVTVTGQKSDKEPALTEVIVIGRKSDKPVLEPVTVTGQKSDKEPALTEVVVTGRKSDKPVLEPVTVTGQKSDKEPALTEVIVTGRKSDKQLVLVLEPVTVTGQKVATPPVLTEVKVTTPKPDKQP